MSVNWKYIANTLTLTKGKNINIIKSIEMIGKLQGNPNPPIYKWMVRFSNGHLMDLHHKDIKKITDFTKEDHKALYEAWKNDEELKKKGYEEIKTKIF
jgi:hypothetical protein